MMNQIKTGMNTALDPDLMEGKKKRERPTFLQWVATERGEEAASAFATTPR
jgi:hypothetical protein